MSLSSLFTNRPANDAERAGEVVPVAELPTRHGLFRIHVFTDAATGLDHVALVSVARIPHVIGPGPLDHAYLETKAQRWWHFLYRTSGEPMVAGVRAGGRMKRVAGLIGMLWAGGCATTSERLHLPPLETVPRVELARYLGTWYEIASFPQRFQRGCTATTATYTLRDDGQIDVVNRCRLGSPGGKPKEAHGRARVVDRMTNAKLEVSFFRPFWGDYWIIDLAPDYSFAVVGHPGRDYLWILSRTPTMNDDTYRRILARLQAQGYETSRLVRTVQPS